MFRFNLFGIQINVEPWFWLTMAFVGGGRNVSNKEGVLNLILFVLAGFISILIHELGHALTIKKYGLPTQVTLSFFGGYATHPAGILTRKQSFIVTAAGPGVQLVFGLIVLAVALTMTFPSENIAYFVNVLCGISLFWAIFNCLPIYPMDGGQMLASVLGPRRAKGVHITGIVCAGALSALALANGQLLIAGFMGLFAWQNYQMLQQVQSR